MALFSRNVCFLAVLMTFFCQRCLTGQPPNIIFILADDVGWNDVSFHGSKEIPTPNLDALAASGIILNRYYTDYLCTPSRSALMTGRYASSIGMQHRVLLANEPRGLPLNLTLMPQYMKQLGYTTYMLGKWHLGFYKKEYIPTSRGFDSYLGYWNSINDYYDYTISDYFSPNIWGRDIRRNTCLDIQLQGNYSTFAYTEGAVNFINNHDKSTPLFMYFAEQAAHAANTWQPLQAPPEYINRFQNIEDTNRQIFAAMMSALDYSVGQVFMALHNNSMLDNSIIVFASDNGGEYPGLWNGSASNWPLRGKKQTFWEGGIHVPAFAWSPLFKHSGKVLNGLFHVTDWLPTLYHAAGGRSKDLKHTTTGVDQYETLCCGARSPRDNILIEIDDISNNGAIRVGNYKLIYGEQYNGLWDGWYGPSGRDVLPSKFDFDTTAVISPILKQMGRRTVPPNYFYDNKDTQILCGPPPQNVHLNCNPAVANCVFDIVNDPCEYNNLAEKDPKLLARMERELRKFRKLVVYPSNLPRDPAGDPKYFNYIWTNWKDPNPLTDYCA